MAIIPVVGKLGEGMSFKFCLVCEITFMKRGLPIHMSGHSSERVRAVYKASEIHTIWLSYNQRLKAWRLASLSDNSFVS